MNIKLIEETLEKNSYPKSFIKKHTKTRIDKLLSKNDQNNINIPITHKNYVTLPFSSKLKKPLTSILVPLNIYPAWTTSNSTLSILTKLKDIEDNNYQSNLIYKINCQICDATYVGETSQYVRKRLNQHKYYIRKNNELHSKACYHTLHTGHPFDYDNFKILFHENQWYKRLIIEACYINSSKTNINNKTDINNCISSYLELLN